MDRTQDHFTKAHYTAQDIQGPVKFLNPTRRHIILPSSATKPALTETTKPVSDEVAVPASEGIYHVWRSRDNRKGRHAVAVTDGYVDKAGVKATNNVKETLRGIGKMFVRYPVWDVSYDVAVIFTLGMFESLSIRYVWSSSGYAPARLTSIHPSPTRPSLTHPPQVQ